METITELQQIQILEQRIKELIKENNLFKNAENRKYEHERPLLFERFGLSNEQFKEIVKFVDFLIYQLRGNVSKIVERIENSPIPLREKLFATYLLNVTKI